MTPAEGRNESQHGSREPGGAGGAEGAEGAADAAQMRGAVMNSKSMIMSGRTQRHTRRGVALLLVLVSLGVAGAATAFYIASRENTPAIGQNAVSAAQADWAAHSAAEIALASLQTEADWRTVAAAGPIIEDMPLGDALVTVVATNEHGELPGVDDVDIVLTAVADVGGVTSSRQLIARVFPDVTPEEAFDPESKEFAVFAHDLLAVGDGAMVDIWALSPGAEIGGLFKVGVGFTSSMNLSIGSGANLLASGLYMDDDSSSALRSMIDDPVFATGAELPQMPPAPPARLPAALAGITASSDDLDVDSVSLMLDTPAQKDVQVNNGGELTLGAGSVSDYRFHRLQVQNSAVLRIEGDVRLWIEGETTLQNESAVELGDGARLRIYAGDNFEVKRSVLGFDRSLAPDGARTRDNVTAYQDPRRVTIYALSPADGGPFVPELGFVEAALANTVIVAPTANVTIRDGSTVFGRVTTMALGVMHSGSALLYDVSLDNQMGFTNTEGPLYNEDGTLVDWAVTTLAGTVDDTTSLLGGILTNAPEDPPSGGMTPLVTPRSSARARARTWPLHALALEGRDHDPNGAGGDGRWIDGTFVRPTDDSINSLGDLGGGGGGGGGGDTLTAPEGTTAIAPDDLAVSPPLGWSPN